MTDEEKKLWDELVEHASDFLVQDYNAILAVDADLARLREENEGINTDRKLLMDTINEKADRIDELTKDRDEARGESAGAWIFWK